MANPGNSPCFTAFNIWMKYKGLRIETLQLSLDRIFRYFGIFRLFTIHDSLRAPEYNIACIFILDLKF